MEKITAQNSTNQSNKLFGTFTEDEVRGIVYGADQSKSEVKFRPDFVINYLKQAERILDKARMNDEQKNFVKGAFNLMAGFGHWKAKSKYEFIIQCDDPDDIRQYLEDGDEEYAIQSLLEEMGFIASDLQNDEDYWFDEYEVEQAKDALEDYYSIINEYGLEEKIYEVREYGWTLDNVKEVLAK